MTPDRHPAADRFRAAHLSLLALCAVLIASALPLTSGEAASTPPPFSLTPPPSQLPASAANAAPSPDQGALGMRGPTPSDPTTAAAALTLDQPVQAFNRLDARINDVEERIAARLKGAPKRRATAALAAIKDEEHALMGLSGAFLEVAVARLSRRLDRLTETYPALRD
jgi:hypothetical protein